MASDQAPRIKLRSAMLTDVGVVRDHNEDSAFVDEEQCFFIVADGMGGHAAGEVASAMAVETVREALDEARPRLKAFAATPTDDGRKDAVNVLESAVRAAHQAVYERGVQETDKQGMGTTLDVVLVAGPEAFIAHVGDSRTYLVRDGKAAQITTDHTVAEVLVIEGKLSLEEAQISPLRTILVNAIGVAPDVGVEMAHVQLRKDDQLLLCSDGLHDYFPVEQELADKMVGTKPDAALGVMIELAKERGGHDNITGVILEVLECAPTTGETIGFGDLDPADASNGVPAPIERDDTIPVDVDDVPKKKTKPRTDIDTLKSTDPMAEAVDPFDITLDAPPDTLAVDKVEKAKAKKAKAKAKRDEADEADEAEKAEADEAEKAAAEADEAEKAEADKDKKAAADEAEDGEAESG